MDEEGRGKIPHFDPARAFQGESVEDQDPADSPSLTLAMTATGTIPDTAGYMSPEQGRGRTADRQADIWPFGVILLEMLTGRPLFARPPPPDLLGLGWPSRFAVTGDGRRFHSPVLAESEGGPAPLRLVLNRAREFGAGEPLPEAFVQVSPGRLDLGTLFDRAEVSATLACTSPVAGL